MAKMIDIGVPTIDLAKLCGLKPEDGWVRWRRESRTPCTRAYFSAGSPGDGGSRSAASRCSLKPCIALPLVAFSCYFVPDGFFPMF
jgi:hypothetical protein